MNIKLRKQCLGMGLIGWVIAIPLTLILLLILVVGFYEGRKAYWDHKVTEMCEKDGGITIYERVTISDELYKKLGGIKGSIPIPPPDRINEDNPYVRLLTITKIREGRPEIRKYETLIKYSESDKTLGRQISFSRVGGDIPTVIAHHSSYSCLQNLSLIKEIFTIEGEL